MIKIPLNDAVLLVRNFGLLVNQATFYGVTHKIILERALVFFQKLIQFIAHYRCVEFSILEEMVAVNGLSEGIDLMTSRNLKEKMMLQKLPGILFLPTLTQKEFLTFLAYLGKPPVVIQELGGFEAILKKESIQGIRLVHFVYKRVDATKAGQEPKPEAEVHPPEPTPTPETQPEPPPSAEQPDQPVTAPVVPAGEAPATPRPRAAKTARAGQKKASKKPKAALAPLAPVPSHVRLRRKRVHTTLSSLLTEVTQLASDDGGQQKKKMEETLRSIRDTLRQSTESSKENIATLLGHPYQPGEDAGGLQKTKPREKPKKLHLTHKEFMARYAELTQELAQPLTVTNSVIEILRNGQAGPINEAQTNFLDLALESVDRVNQLIKYMHTLSGEPETYIPDAKIIQETYV